MEQPTPHNTGNRILKDLEAGRVSSDDLFSKGRELIIVHQEQEYKMRITGNGKLILTK